MRFAVVLTVVLVVLLFSCRQPQLCCGPAIQPGLIGGWHLIRVEGGIAGSVINVPADSMVLLTLNNDSTYQLLNGSAPADSGTFHVADTSVYSGPVILFNPGITPVGGGFVPYLLSNDTLFLGSGYNDGYEAIYLKIY